MIDPNVTATEAAAEQLANDTAASDAVQNNDPDDS